ncbi:MAG TPA: DUF309 domain-containing protein [Oligoflexia bacterium]|nr:DUF309 domain-containing protein [Oligoflexia bacterium]HMR24710.1 DUF309 domain-containing protein [Oligoflexia bacterium]
MVYQDRYLLFIEYFNQSKFMSAQTTLDELWLKDQSKDKDFYGGLIQIAVSLYHLTQDNPRGAAKIYSRARDMIIKYGDEHNDIALKKLRDALDELYQRPDLTEMNPMELIRLVPKIQTLQNINNA